MVRRNKVFAYLFEDYWQDIGTIETYYAAHMGLISEFPALGLHGRSPILTGNNTSLSSKIRDEHNIGRNIISPGCTIRGQVENSILCPSVIVEKQALVRNSVIMANTVIGAHSVVDHCILDEDVNVGKFCYIGHRSHPIQRDRDIIVIVKGLVIPDYSEIYRSFGIPINETSLTRLVNAA
jgi:glucose-1-phosphate adenylyltransferase